MRKLLDLLLFFLGLDCDTRRKSVSDGLCDFSGQGRDENGI